MNLLLKWIYAPNSNFYVVSGIHLSFGKFFSFNATPLKEDVFSISLLWGQKNVTITQCAKTTRRDVTKGIEKFENQ